MLVFMAGATIFGHLHARAVVVSISSAIPYASFAITFAVAGAIRRTSAFLAAEICFTSNSNILSNVSVMHLLFVRVSNVSGDINLHAFSVIITFVSALSLTSELHRPAIL